MWQLIGGFVMKKLSVLVLTIVMFVGLSVPSSAQYFMSSMSDARTIAADGISIGGGISVFEGLLGLGGTARVGIMDGLELGGKVGIVNYDSKGGDNDHTGLSVGAEIKYQLLDFGFGDPIDFAISGGAEYYNSGENSTLWMFGGNTIVSYPVEFQNGQILSPFFRLNLRFDRASEDVNDGTRTDNDFEIGFGFGAMYDISNSFGFFMEVIIGGGSMGEGFVGGVWFGI
jgi:Outer membrane protein beta-barrel domain